MDNIIDWFLSVVLFLIPLYSGLYYGIKRHLFGFLWTEIALALLFVLSLVWGFDYKEVVFLNILPGFVLGIALRYLWISLKMRLNYSESFGIIIFLVMLGIYLLNKEFPGNILTVFFVSALIWMPVEIYRRIKEHKFS